MSAGHIGEGVDWSYSAPVHLVDAVYDVVATASLDLGVDFLLLPVARLFSLTVPFDLRIDTDTRDVQGTADLGNAALSTS